MPKIRSTLIGCVVFTAAVAVIAPRLAPDNLISWSQGLALGIIMLSLVPLMGYAGQVSLAQMSFAGLGAYAAATWGDGSPLSYLAAVALACAAGVLVALPALRLQGVYLALATLAFAFIVEKFVFAQPALFPTTAKPVSRPTMFGVAISDGRVYAVFLSVIFGLLTMALVVLRRGPFGRRLQAMKDSPAACATLGLNLTRTKLSVFALSSAIAGLGGALFAGVNKTVSIPDYAALQNLPVLLMAVAGGIALCSGALVGGLLLGSFNVGNKSIPSFQILGFESVVFFTNLLAAAPGLIGIALGRNPNGIVVSLGEWWRTRGDAGRRTSLPIDEAAAVETMGIDGDFASDELGAIERVVRVEGELNHVGA